MLTRVSTCVCAVHYNCRLCKCCGFMMASCSAGRTHVLRWPAGPLVHAPAIASHTVRGNNGWSLRWRGHGAPSPRLMGAATTSTSRSSMGRRRHRSSRHRSSCHLDRHRRRHRSSPSLVTTARRLRAPPRHRSSPPLIATAHRHRSSPVRLRSSPPLVATARRLRSVHRHRCQTAVRACLRRRRRQPCVRACMRANVCVVRECLCACVSVCLVHSVHELLSQTGPRDIPRDCDLP